jgi:ribosomal protein S16
VKIDTARVEYWVSKGAQLSPTVKSLLKKLAK